MTLALPTSSGCLVGFAKPGYAQHHVIHNIFVGNNAGSRCLLSECLNDVGWRGLGGWMGGITYPFGEVPRSAQSVA
jgi:hypothetical protein